MKMNYSFYLKIIKHCERSRCLSTLQANNATGILANGLHNRHHRKGDDTDELCLSDIARVAAAAQSHKIPVQIVMILLVAGLIVVPTLTNSAHN